MSPTGHLVRNYSIKFRLGTNGAIRTKKFTLYQIRNSSLARFTRGTVSDV